MSQSRKQSVAEALVNQATGFLLSILVWEYIVKPGWGIQTSMSENMSITALFTAVSIARGYTCRRFFNRLHNKNKKDNRTCHTSHL